MDDDELWKMDDDDGSWMKMDGSWMMDQTKLHQTDQIKPTRVNQKNTNILLLGKFTYFTR